MKDAQFTTVPSAIANPKFWVIVLTLLAFGLRVWHLGSVPPGWRDDELINSLVISQKVLDGDWAVYYPDASGHEALYHVLNAAMLGLFGPGVAGIRLLSAILGTLTIPFTYLVANRLYGWKVALLAATGLTFSFWSLMYSRIGIRHISLPLFMLASFYFFLRGFDFGEPGIEAEDEEGGANYKDYLLAGLFMGIAFYTYFASRGVPVILLATSIFIALFHRILLRRRWVGLMLMFVLALLIALPLITTLIQQPESEARVGELAVPLVEARAGNFQPLKEHISRTLSMFHSDGDEEWLYNIPFRPVFGPLAAIFFWVGVFIAGWYSLKPLLRFIVSRLDRRNLPASLGTTPRFEVAGAFLLIWLLVGIGPAFVSVPPASLGHTIVALPAVYILVALPIFSLEQLDLQSASRRKTLGFRGWLTGVIGLLLLISIACRDMPDYFQDWPNRGMTRFLYRAEIKELALYLNKHPELIDFGVTGLLAGPWDKIALEIDLDGESAARPRWYNPDRVTLLRSGGEPALSFGGYPSGLAFDKTLYQLVSGERAGAYQLMRAIPEDDHSLANRICYQNGLCLIHATYDLSANTLELTWEVARQLDLPDIPLISNPPPPGIYAGPRLLVFSHLIDADGRLIASDDGLWADVTTLRPGDQFRQLHRFNGPFDDATSVAFGLYDPMTGKRILTEDGRDQLNLLIDAVEK